MTNKQIKIALIGSSSSGKTTYIERIMNGEFERNYISSININSFLLKKNEYNYDTDIIFYDIPSQYDLNELNMNFDGILLFIDIIQNNNHTKINNEINFYDKYINKFSNKVLICLNKCDLNFKLKNIIDNKYKYETIVMSVKSCYNYEKPISIMIQ
jgi:GTPase SAR1 family protein